MDLYLDLEQDTNPDEGVVESETDGPKHRDTDLSSLSSSLSSSSSLHLARQDPGNAPKPYLDVGEYRAAARLWHAALTCDAAAFRVGGWLCEWNIALARWTFDEIEEMQSLSLRDKMCPGSASDSGRIS